MSIQARITALALIMLVLCASHWRAYTVGQQRQRDAQAAAQLQTTQTQAATAIRQADQTIEAQNERTKTERRLAAERLRTASDIERLRIDLDAARTTAQSTDTCTDRITATDQLLRSMAADIEQLAKQGANTAQAADSHAADALMLLRVLLGE